MSTPRQSEYHDLLLDGCNPVPLASYLKALGVLRLVAEQVDPEARGYWRDDRFVLWTRLDEDGLRRFLLDEYRPTPVLAPWNGGSGFFYREEKLKEIDPTTGKRKKTGRRCEPTEATRTLDALLDGGAERLLPYRESILVAKDVLAELALEEAPKGEAKDELIHALRSALPGAGLDCLDATLVLTPEKTRYPPLFGTGGTDGNLDFTNNFMQRVLSLFEPDSGHSRPAGAKQLDASLFAIAARDMQEAAVGQFAPGSAGGANQATGFEGKSLINPWDFVLTVEGALLFAAAATRRLEATGPSSLSYPFTVRPTGAGSGAATIADEQSTRAEFWAPLWSAPTGLYELRGLLAEGRATIGRRPAVDGLDFVRAVSRLGVARGIEVFQRYAFLMRSGRSYFATPLNRVATTRNPNLDLVDELDQNGWLERFRRLARTDRSARVVSLARRLEDAIFNLALTQDAQERELHRLLAALGEVQLYLARNGEAREKCPPVPWLSSKQWLDRADDGTPEFGVAAALAGLHGLTPASDDQKRHWVLPMRGHLAPERSGRYPAWDESARHSVTWGSGSLEANLVTTLQRRLLQATKLGLDDKPIHATRMTSVASVAAWLAGTLDERRIAGLLPGLTLIRVPGGADTRATRLHPLPAAYRVLKPFFCTNDQLVRSEILPPDSRLNIPAEMVRRIDVGDVDGAVELAIRRLRVAGVTLDFRDLSRGRLPGRRMLAALLVPIPDYELKRLLPGKQEDEERAAPAS